MSIQDIFEEGDTGEAILPVPVSAIAARLNASRVEVDGSTLVEAEKVGGVGVHADRDGSEEDPRLDFLWSLSEWQMRSALAFLSGYDPELFDRVVRRR